MAGGIDLLAGTGNSLTAVHRFHPGHDSSEIFGNGQIITHQLFQGS